MGKPAARLMDSTAHGGMITGPGAPNVLIGKMPAATLGDLHMCPMMTPAVPPIPHVGGPIMLGSMGVLIGKKPAARLGDMCMCVGPPSTVIMGCMTVLIGEAGSGSQAAAAKAAAAAMAAKATGPKAIKPFVPPEIPKTNNEHHVIACEFVDSAGKPLAGVFYRIKDPNQKDLIGVSTSEGKAYHPGYAKAGSYSLTVQTVTEAKWDKDEIAAKDKVGYSAKADGFDEGTQAFIAIYGAGEGGANILVELVEGKVQGGKVQGKWDAGKALHTPEKVSDALDACEHFYLQICVEHLVAVSSMLKVHDTLEIELTGDGGKPRKDVPYTVTLRDGTVLKGKLDAQSRAKHENIARGGYKVVFGVETESTHKAGSGTKGGSSAKPGTEEKSAKSGNGMGDLKEAEREQDENEVKANKEPPWLLIARNEIGVQEIAGPKNNPRIVEYNAATTLKATDDETPWCSAFVNWAMMKCDIQGTKSAKADSWANWGMKIDNPVYGCIIVFKNHVGFVVGRSGKNLMVLGGNQHDAVNISPFKTTHVIAYAYPINYDLDKRELPDLKADGDTLTFQDTR